MQGLIVAKAESQGRYYILVSQSLWVLVIGQEVLTRKTPTKCHLDPNVALQELCATVCVQASGHVTLRQKPGRCVMFVSHIEWRQPSCGSSPVDGHIDAALSTESEMCY